MGAKTQVLLVITLSLFLHIFPVMAKVDAGEHQGFWLWSGVRPTAEMHDAQVVYLHQGEVVVRGGTATFERMGLPVSRLSFPRIWVTVRITTLNVPDDIWLRVGRLIQRWQAAGNNVVGLQIDFDAATHRLSDYSEFLRRLRAVLPQNIALGVTGLLDWAKTGDIATLNRLPVNELIVQSYQGRSTVKSYGAYLPALSNLRIPWKLGLVQNGDWDSPRDSKLWQSPWFRGTVVFMLNPR